MSVLKKIGRIFFVLFFAVIIVFPTYGNSNTFVTAEKQNLSGKKYNNASKGRYSMFIHWGLYSVYGGVYRGKNVEWGYSEQIQSFAGIFSDWYARTAEQFTATDWNADSIAELAVNAGMEGVVMTSKHHDGFCMYDSKFTDFTITKATPFGRDALKEMSDACKRHGLNFGIYFSLIDWHYPWAYPISSHNADPITPEHHEYNKNQVRELLSNYGNISELWFDMGSLKREQSKELYDLVKSIQPDCMVSGRIGNDYGDFAVMPDNTIPDFISEKPWQTAESVYKETWSYRSWQKHVPLSEKLAEKIGALKKIVGASGNYLLNIGPMGNGAVTEYERNLLLSMGRWIDSTKWLKNAKDSIFSKKTLPDKSLFKNKNKIVAGGKSILFLENAQPLYFFSMFDYYVTHKATYGYRWYVPSVNKISKYKFIIPNINADFEVVDIKGNKIKLSKRREVLNNDVALKYLPLLVSPKVTSANVKELIPVKPDEVIEREFLFSSDKDGIASFKIGTADAIEVWLEDNMLVKKMFTKESPEPLVVAVPVVKGANKIVIKLYNRFEKDLNYTLESVATKYFEVY